MNETESSHKFTSESIISSSHQTLFLNVRPEIQILLDQRK